MGGRRDGGERSIPSTEEGGARGATSLRRWDANLRGWRRTTTALVFPPQEKESVAIGREDATMANRHNDARDLEARVVVGDAFLIVIEMAM